MHHHPSVSQATRISWFPTPLCNMLQRNRLASGLQPTSELGWHLAQVCGAPVPWDSPQGARSEWLQRQPAEMVGAPVEQGNAGGWAAHQDAHGRGLDLELKHSIERQAERVGHDTADDVTVSDDGDQRISPATRDLEQRFPGA